MDSTTLLSLISAVTPWVIDLFSGLFAKITNEQTRKSVILISRLGFSFLLAIGINLVYGAGFPIAVLFEAALSFVIGEAIYRGRKAVQSTKVVNGQ